MAITGCKRSREEQEQDVPMGPQVEVVRDPRPKPTTEDSIQFMWTMKCELASEREKYAEFPSQSCVISKTGGMSMLPLDFSWICRDLFSTVLFVSGCIQQNLAGVVDDVKALLAWHPNLIRGFNEFLSWDYIRSQGQGDGGSGSGSATSTVSEIS